ncbi:hypothetical protein ACWGE8_39690, partial [Streptomyces virginiae]
VLGNAVATWIGVGETKGIDWTRHLLQIVGAVARLIPAASRRRQVGHCVMWRGSQKGRPHTQS